MIDFLRSPTFVLLFAANVVQATGFALLLHLPGYLTLAGFSESEIGTIFAGGSIVAVLGSPPLGRALDRFGRRPMILAGIAVSGLATAGFALAGPVDWALPAWLLVALSIALNGLGLLVMTAFLAYAVDVVPADRKAQGLALFGISAMGAVGLGAVTGDAAIALGGYDGLFAAMLLLLVLAGGIALALREIPHHPEDGGAPKRGWTGLVLSPEMLIVWLLTGLFFFAMTGIFVFLKVWAVETGIGSIGLFFAFYAGTAVCLRIFFGWLPDRIGTRRMAPLALAIYSLAFLVLAGTGSVTVLILAAVLGGVGHGFSYPVLLSLATDRAGRANRGAAVSIFGAVDEAGALVAAPVLGLAIEAAGFASMYAWLGIGLLAGAALFLAFDRRIGARVEVGLHRSGPRQER